VSRQVDAEISVFFRNSMPTACRNVWYAQAENEWQKHLFCAIPSAKNGCVHIQNPALIRLFSEAFFVKIVAKVSNFCRIHKSILYMLLYKREKRDDQCKTNDSARVA